MDKRNSYIFIFKVSFFLILSYIISTDLNSQPSKFVFKHLNVEDGLSQSTVHAITQDRKGFMWFGTDIGLNKYDGHKFVVYQNNAMDTTTIASNFIVEVYEDSYNCLWVGNGYNGLDKFDREKEIFIHYKNNPKNPESLCNNNIRVIFEDKFRNLWIGTSGGGLCLFNRKKETFTRFVKDSNNPNSIGSNFVSGISQDSKGNLWIGSTEGVLTKYDQANKKFTNFPLYGQFKSDLFNTTFGTTYVDSKDFVRCQTKQNL